MRVDTPAIPPQGEPKKNNNWLWGCLIALVLALVIVCCGSTLVLMPLFSVRDSLGMGLWDRIEDYLEDPSSIQELEELLVEEFYSEGENTISGGYTKAEDIPLAVFNFLDIGMSFSYPAGWNIEMEGYGVTFYDPDSYTYIYMGEDVTDLGTRAEDITLEIIETVQEEAQEGTFQLINSTAYSVSIAGDAHLTLFEWVDLDGYYTWAYDLEMVSGESNIYIFLSGENPDEIPLYGELLDIIAASLGSIPDEQESEDA
jgi:hypothetical protein